MDHIVKCPVDGEPLAMTDQPMHQVIWCPSCRLSFRVTFGTLTGRWNETAEKGKKVSARTMRFRVSAGQSDPVEISSHFRDQQDIAVKNGKKVLIIEKMLRDGDFELISVHAHSPEQLLVRYEYPADELGMIRGLGLSIRVFAWLFLLLVFAGTFLGWWTLFFLPLVMAIAAGLGHFRRVFMDNRRTIDPQEADFRRRMQWLLQEIEGYRARMGKTRKKIREYGKQVADMKKLTERMNELTGHEHRVELISRGIAALEEHMKNDQEMMEALTRVHDSLAVEYESARVLNRLPDPASMQGIQQTVMHMKAIEDANAQLEAELEANAEVQLITSSL